MMMSSRFGSHHRSIPKYVGELRSDLLSWTEVITILSPVERIQCTQKVWSLYGIQFLNRDPNERYAREDCSKETATAYSCKIGARMRIS